MADEKNVIQKMQGPKVDPLTVGIHDKLKNLSMRARRLRAHGGKDAIHFLRKPKGRPNS